MPILGSEQGLFSAMLAEGERDVPHYLQLYPPNNNQDKMPHSSLSGKFGFLSSINSITVDWIIGLSLIKVLLT